MRRDAGGGANDCRTNPGGARRPWGKQVVFRSLAPGSDRGGYGCRGGRGQRRPWGGEKVKANSTLRRRRLIAQSCWATARLAEGEIEEELHANCAGTDIIV